MMRRRGFTLIELLVVIAIIGILAAMLFPVFARARESARKTQCLSNVKNLAIAFNMYITDYDRFPPDETDSNVLSYFYSDADTEGPGGCGVCNDNQTCRDVGKPYAANPYLRLPVILDDYVKNRDIWKCPSAKWTQGAEWIVPDTHPGGWLQYYKDTQGVWGSPGSVGRVGPCQEVYPPGWGGVVTDSFVQQTCADWETGYFEFSYGVNVGRNKGWPANAGVSLSAIDDSGKYVIVGEMGSAGGPLFTVMSVAYPYAHSGFVTICDGCGCGDWENCTYSQVCGVGFGADAARFATDPTYRNNKYTVHMGGQNLGFADGHAKWYSAGNILAEAPKYQNGGCCGSLVYSGLTGIVPDGPTMPAAGGTWAPSGPVGKPCGQTYPLLY